MSAITPEVAEATQGPAWWGAFLNDPPLWFKAALVGLAIVVVGLALRSVIRRDWYISPDEQESIALILATVDGVAIGVVASMWLLPLGYLGDVVVGLVVGLAGVEAVVRVLRRVAAPIKREIRLMAMWAALTMLPFGIPIGAELAGAPPPPGIAQGGVAAAIIFGMWSLGQELGDGETLGDAVRSAMAAPDGD